jgi:hypothetical protein
MASAISEPQPLTNQLVERLRLKELLNEAKALTDLPEPILIGGAIVGLVVVLFLVIGSLIQIVSSSPTEASSSSATTTKKTKSKSSPKQDISEEQEKLNGSASFKAGAAALADAKLAVAALAPQTSSITTVSTPTSPVSSPPKDGGSPQVLHTGSLKKRSFFSSATSTVELYREDEQNIALFYAPASTTKGSSPRETPRRASLYLGGESHIEIGSRTRFTVHQLKSGGKTLQLESRSDQEREQWISRIQEAIDSLRKKN